MRSANAEGVGLVVTAALGSLNSVDCSTAPDCAALGRNLCTYTANTCGSCINGFYGVSGDSNTRCFASGDISATAGYRNFAYDRNRLLLEGILSF